MRASTLAIFRTLAFLVFAAVVAMGVYVSLAPMPFGFDLSQKGIFERVELLGPWRGPAIVGLMILHSFVPFPAEVVTFAAGRLLGPVWGTVFAWTGAMIGAVLAFALSRAFGRSFVDAVLPERARERLESWSTTKSAMTLLVARFIPVIAFNLINYAAGLTPVRWWTFIWTTGVGILPLTVFFVVLGERMQGASWLDWGLFALAAVCLSLVVRGLLAWARRRGWIDM
jgi:uncharacterized membrane protein YdjX (TVP38/TMEM64 family)